MGLQHCPLPCCPLCPLLRKHLSGPLFGSSPRLCHRPMRPRRVPRGGPGLLEPYRDATWQVLLAFPGASRNLSVPLCDDWFPMLTSVSTAQTKRLDEIMVSATMGGGRCDRRRSGQPVNKEPSTSQAPFKSCLRCSIFVATYQVCTIITIIFP